MPASAAWYLANRERLRAYKAAWHQAHRDDQRKQFKARYRKHRLEAIAKQRTYRRTAAGMLTSVRHSAKARKA